MRSENNRPKKRLNLMQRLRLNTLGLWMTGATTCMQIGYVTVDAWKDSQVDRNHEHELVESNARYRALADEVKALHVKLDGMRKAAVQDTTGTKH